MPKCKTSVLLYGEDGSKRLVSRSIAEKIAALPTHKEYRNKAGDITHIVVCRKAATIARSRKLTYLQSLGDHRAYALRHPNGDPVTP